jgi:hypothetical protein
MPSMADIVCWGLMHIGDLIWDQFWSMAHGCLVWKGMFFLGPRYLWDVGCLWLYDTSICHDFAGECWKVHNFLSCCSCLYIIAYFLNDSKTFLSSLAYSFASTDSYSFLWIWDLDLQNGVAFRAKLIPFLALQVLLPTLHKNSWVQTIGVATVHVFWHRHSAWLSCAPYATVSDFVSKSGGLDQHSPKTKAF